MQKAQSCNNVASLQNIKIEADALKVRFLNEIATYITKRQAEMEEEERKRREAEKQSGESNTNSGMKEPAITIKKQKTISIKNVNTSTTWQLETQEDVQKYINALQNKLNSLLEKDTIINIEF